MMIKDERAAAGWIHPSSAYSSAVRYTASHGGRWVSVLPLPQFLKELRTLSRWSPTHLVE